MYLETVFKIIYTFKIILKKNQDFVQKKYSILVLNLSG